MPREVMTIEQVAAYLHLPVRDVDRLASRGQIPARKVGGRFVFRKGQIDHWVEQRMGGLDADRLEQIERGVTAHHGIDRQSHLVADLIPPGGVLLPINGRTKEGVLRAMVAAADDAGLVYDRNDLLENLRAREALCPTTLMPGAAFPHPRHPLPYDIAESFLIVGRTESGIPFGCPDGTLTRLFFLICCKDDRTHLHVLARLSRMLDRTVLEALLEATEPAEAVAALQDRERELIDELKTP